MLGELLLAFSIILACLGLALPRLPRNNQPLQANLYQSELLALQTKAMIQGESESDGGIKFNQLGHINGGRTLSFGKKKLVIFLGMGRSEVRQRDAAD